MKQLSSMMTGPGLQRLEHAADAGAAGDVAVLADLRAGADRRPGVDHGAAIDIGAEIDEGRHQHHARRDEGRAAHHAPGTARKPAFLNFAAFQPLNLESTLSHHTALPGPPGDHAHVVEAERQQHRFLQPLVDLPAAVGLALGDARFAGIEQIERGVRPPCARAPLVFGPILSRASKASSMILASLSWT